MSKLCTVAAGIANAVLVVSAELVEMPLPRKRAEEALSTMARALLILYAGARFTQAEVVDLLRAQYSGPAENVEHMISELGKIERVLREEEGE